MAYDVKLCGWQTDLHVNIIKGAKPQQTKRNAVAKQYRQAREARVIPLSPVHCQKTWRVQICLELNYP